jgi:hypothetical protein
MTAFSLHKTPLALDTRVEGHSSSIVDQTETVAFGYRARALALERRVQQEIRLTRDVRHRWTAGGGLVHQIIGDDIRSRILTDVQISLGNRELPRNHSARQDVLRDDRPLRGPPICAGLTLAVADRQT